MLSTLVRQWCVVAHLCLTPHTMLLCRTQQIEMNRANINLDLVAEEAATDGCSAKQVFMGDQACVGYTYDDLIMLPGTHSPRRIGLVDGESYAVTAPSPPSCRSPPCSPGRSECGIDIAGVQV
jgi:hypothetical protein